MSEQVVKIVATLYQARDAMRTILGDRYVERCQFWRDSINRVMQREGCGVMEACVKLAKEADGKGSNPAVLFAATVEMIEGIWALPKIGTVVSYRQTHPAHADKFAEGNAEVRQYLTAENAPAPHMRPSERTLWVRGVEGTMRGQHFIVKQSEVITP